MTGTNKSGRRRQPVAQLKLRGTYRPDRNGTDFQQFPEGKIACPRWLDERGRKHFRETLKTLQQVPHLVSLLDKDALVQYAAAWSDFRDATDHIAKHGAEIEDKHGIVRSNPAIRRKYKAAEVIRHFMIRLGMTPSDRANLRLPEAEEEDAFDKFLRMRMEDRG